MAPFQSVVRAVFPHSLKQSTMLAMCYFKVMYIQSYRGFWWPLLFVSFSAASFDVQTKSLDVQIELHSPWLVKESFIYKDPHSNYIQKLLEARESEGSTIVGTGITMEGIGTNYAVYDFMTDLSIILPKNTTVNSKTWFDDYSERRYGESNQFAKLAWNLLLNSVYNYTGNEAPHGQFVFNNRPSLKKQVKYWYDPMAVASAWQLLLNAARTIKRPIDLFKHDLVDVTRQSIQHLLDQRYLKIIEAYRNRNLTIIQQESTQFLEMLDDLDKVLETDEHFLLGIWLNSAKALATTPLERRVYERDARNQISLWGPDGEILDYANKQWAGVVRDYFKPRWVVFFKYLEQAATTRGNFDNKKYQRDVFEAEKHFAYSYGEYTAVKTGDSIQVSQMLFNKWQPIM